MWHLCNPRKSTPERSPTDTRPVPYLGCRDPPLWSFSGSPSTLGLVGLLFPMELPPGAWVSLCFSRLPVLTPAVDPGMASGESSSVHSLLDLPHLTPSNVFLSYLKICLLPLNSILLPFVFFFGEWTQMRAALIGSPFPNSTGDQRKGTPWGSRWFFHDVWDPCAVMVKLVFWGFVLVSFFLIVSQVSFLPEFHKNTCKFCPNPGLGRGRQPLNWLVYTFLRVCICPTSTVFTQLKQRH